MYDYAIIGSGFGGSVSALRLVEKGYRVLVLEKGQRLQAEDFPEDELGRQPLALDAARSASAASSRCPFRHVTVLSGVGVGGGSLVYANTLPDPEGRVLREPVVGASSPTGSASSRRTTRPPAGCSARRRTAPDPRRRGPPRDRRGDGPRRGTSRAARRGLLRQAGQDASPIRTSAARAPSAPAATVRRVHDGLPRRREEHARQELPLPRREARARRSSPTPRLTTIAPRVDGGYRLEVREGRSYLARKTVRYEAKNVVFSGGVLGTMRSCSASRPTRRPAQALRPPRLRRPHQLRVAPHGERPPGEATTSRRASPSARILQTDEHSHLELTRYGAGSGFFRLLLVPHARGRAAIPPARSAISSSSCAHPIRRSARCAVPDWSRVSHDPALHADARGHPALRARPRSAS